MKMIKQAAALILCVCILCGMPFSVSVMATDTETPTDLRLVGAQPILQSFSVTNWGPEWNDRMLVLYFNQAVAWGEVSTVRLVVVDDNGQVVTYNNKPLYWKTGSAETSIYGVNGYILRIFSTEVTYNGQTVLTWASIMDMLANDAELKGKGYRLQVRAYEKSSPSGDGLVNSVKAGSNAAQCLTANATDTNLSLVGMSGTRDYAYINIGTVAAGVAQLTPTGTVTLDRVQMADETNMTLTFSQAVTIDTARTETVMQVVDGTTGKIVKSAAVTLSAGNASTVRATLNDSTWTQMKACKDEASDRTIRLKLTEKDILASQAEYAFSYTVDTVEGTADNMPLKSDGYAADQDGRMDYVTAPVAEPKDAFRLVGAAFMTESMMPADMNQSIDYQDKTILLAFGSAVAATVDADMSGKATARLAVVDSTDTVVSCGGTDLMWKAAVDGTVAWQLTGARLRLTSSVTVDGTEIDTLSEIVSLLATHTELAGKGYRLQVRLFEHNNTCVANGRIDSIHTAEDSGITLAANTKATATGYTGTSASYDCTTFDLGYVEKDADWVTATGVVTLDKVQMTSDTYLALTFSESVKLDLTRLTASLQVVDGSGNTVDSLDVTLRSDQDGAVHAYGLINGSYAALAAKATGAEHKIMLVLTESGQTQKYDMLIGSAATSEGKPLIASRGSAGQYDSLAVAVTAADTTGHATLDKAETITVQDQEYIKMTFSEPIAFDLSNADFSIRLIDGFGEDDGAVWPLSDVRFYGPTGQCLIGKVETKHNVSDYDGIVAYVTDALGITLNNANRLVLSITDKTQTDDLANGGILSEDGTRKLYSNLPGVNEDLTVIAVTDTEIEALYVENVEVYSDKYVIVTFSQPITKLGSSYLTSWVRLVYSDNNMAQSNQWPLNFKPYGLTTNKLIATLPDGAEWSVLKAKETSELTLKLCFEEIVKDGVCRGSTRTVDSIYVSGEENELERNYLIANKPGKRVTSYDGTYIDFANPNPISGITNVVVLDDKTLELTFPTGVVMNQYNGTTTQAMIGFSDENYTIQSTQVYLSSSRPLHEYRWYGSLSPVEDSWDEENGGYKVWRAMDFYNTYRGTRQELKSIYDLMSAVLDEDSIHYNKIMIAGIEQQGLTEDVKGYVDNVTSADGARLLTANHAADGYWVKLTRDNLADPSVSTTPVKAIDYEILNETQMKITFSDEISGQVEFAGIRMTDSTGHMVCNNPDTPVLSGGPWYQWGGSFEPCKGDADDEWILTLTWTTARDTAGNKVSFDFTTMYDLWESHFKDKGYELNFAIESKSGQMMRDGLINDFTNAYGRALLATREPSASATQSVWFDCLHLSITSEDFLATDAFASSQTPYIVSVKQHGTNSVLVTFSEAVAIRNEAVSKPYIGLRLVSDADLGVAFYNRTTDQMTTNSRRCDADGNKLYLNELTGEVTTEKICKDAGGNVQYDENGNEKTNKALNNTVQQWNAVETVMVDPTQMLVTFHEHLDVAALVSEENLPDYIAKDYSIRFCIEETDNKDGSLFVESNKLIHNVTNAGNRQLRANKEQKGYDGILMPIELVDPDQPITVTDVTITGEVEMVATFSEAIDLSKHASKYAYLCYVDPQTGRTLQTDEDGTLRWRGRIAYTDQLKTKVTWTMESKNPANENLRQTSLAEVFELVKNKDSIKNLDGVFRFCMEETYNATQGFIDSFFGLTGKLIEAAPYVPNILDGIYADVDTAQVIVGELSIVRAVAVADNELLVTFSAPIAIEHDPFFCIRLFNADNAMLWKAADGTYTTAAVDKDGNDNAPGQWSINWEFANEEHTQIRCRVNGSKKLDCRNVSEIFAFDWSTVAEGAHFRFYVEELGEPMVLKNCHVDNIALASDSRIHLDATDFNSRDGAGIVITQEYTPVTVTPTVTVISECQLRISFSRRVEIEGKPYMAIGYVDEENTLLTYRDNGKNYAQWDGKWEWEDDSHTSIIWTKTNNTHGCRTIADIVNKIGLLKHIYPDAKVMFRIEDASNDEFSHLRWNGLIDNISAANGTVHLSGNAAGGSDRCWLNLSNTQVLEGEQLELLSVRAIDNMTLELTFSEAVTIKQGDEAPTMAIRYLTDSGDTEVGVDGRTISFSGTWKYKDENKNVILWTLNAEKAQQRGASNLDDILTFANTLKWNRGARVAFVIFDDEDQAFSPSSMRIRGISDVNGYRNLVATIGGEEVSQLQKDIEVGYDLPGSVENIEETVYVTDYLPFILMSAALIVASAVVAVILIVRHKKRKEADK